MNNSLSRVWIGAAAVLTLILLLVVVSTQQAGAGTVVSAFSVDMDPSGNSATAVGTTETCGEIANVGETLTVDLILRGVPTGGITGYAGSLIYDQTVVKVTSATALMLYTEPKGTPFNILDPLPDSDGDWIFSYGELGEAAPKETGDGVAVRVVIEAVGAGTSQLHLGDTYEGDDMANVYDETGFAYQITSITDGEVRVGSSCPAAVTNTPTPTGGVTGTPTFTPGATSPGQTASPTPDGSATPTETPGGSPTPTGTPDGTPRETPDGTPTETPDGTPTATPTPTPTGGTQQKLMGDTDCDGSITTRDNQALLRKVLQQNPLSQTEPCPDPGTTVNGSGNLDTWGDWDCDGSVTTRDNQALLRDVLDQNALSQTEPCPDIGTPTNI